MKQMSMMQCKWI